MRRLDVAGDPLPEATFDLIHERAVLIHLTDPRATIERLARALKPGGWLLCEDTDFVTAAHAAPASETRAAFAAMVAFFASRGGDINFGRRLFAALQAAGLADVQADGAVYTIRGGHPSATLPKYTLERVRAPVLARGGVSEADYDAAIALFDDPSFSMTSPLMVAAWGRK